MNTKTTKNGTNVPTMKADFDLNYKFKKYEQIKLKQVAAAIASNIGFSSATNSSISTLSFLLRTNFESLCRDSLEMATHAGRTFVTLDDASSAFSRQPVNLTELHDYIKQVESFGTQEDLPLFPIPSDQLKTHVEQEEKAENLEVNKQKEEDLLIALKQSEAEAANKFEQQRTNIRLAQRTFPKFFDRFASELGLTVQKIVPPTVESGTECQFTKIPENFNASLTLFQQEHLVGPSLSAKAVAGDSRHKEKKKKKKEKREMEEKGGNEEGKKHKGKKHAKGDEHNLQDVSMPEPIVTPLKVPKIKIRLGPGPVPTTTEESSLESTKIAPTIHMDDQTVKLDETTPEVQLASQVHTNDARRIEAEKSPEKQLTVPPIRIKSPPKQVSLPVEVSVVEKPLNEVKISDESESTQIVVNQPDTVTISSVKEEEPAFVESAVTPELVDQIPTAPKAPPTAEKQLGKKRSRKSEKPLRLTESNSSSPPAADPQSSPPGIPPAPSKALESVLEQRIKSFVDTPPKELKKSSEPPMTFASYSKADKSGRNSAQAKFVHTEESAKKGAKPKTKPVGKTKKTAPVHSTQMDEEQDEDIWICPICSVAYVETGPDMVACDQCDRWFHWGCVGILLPPPENAPWFCSDCKKIKRKKLSYSGGESRRNSAGAPPTKKKQRPAGK